MPEETYRGRRKFRVTTPEERQMLEDARMHFGQSARRLLVQLGYRDSVGTAGNFGPIYNGRTMVSPKQWEIVKKYAMLRRETKRDSDEVLL
jgi:hypothetical protein